MGKRGRPPHPDILTPREWQVLALLREGLTNEQIAQRLDISLATVKYHVSEILSKLNVTTREQAAAWRPEAVAARWRQRATAWVPRHAWPFAAAGALAALTSLVFLAWVVMDGDGEEPTAMVQPATTSIPSPVFSSPTIEPEPTVTASSEVSASASPNADALPATAIKIFYQQDSASLPREPKPEICFQSSSFDPGRSDAWRCPAWDPCFEIPTDVLGEAELLCVGDPWSGDGAFNPRSLVHFEGSVPAHEQYQITDYSKPWALELANGLRCSFVGGGTSSVDGERVNYGCGCGEERCDGWIVGYPDQSSSTWRVRLVEFEMPFNTVLSSESVFVLIAWF